MKITVTGCGYLGAVHAASMAELGHDVLGIDVDTAKVERLNSGQAPFHEPGFDALLSRNVDAGRLRFTTDTAEAADYQVHFVAVGTPQAPGGHGADLSYVDAAFTGLLPHLSPHPDGPTLVIGKSTVPVGTAAAWAPRVAEHEAILVWNPEFLREGLAVQDTICPDRLVYGLPAEPSLAEQGRQVLDAVYHDLVGRQRIPRILADYATAELVKVAANSFLATKISFINAMAELCEATGGDVSILAEAIGHDERIGSTFLRAGAGFGGGCLPKDIRAFMARAEELGTGDALSFLREVDSINLRRRDRLVGMAAEMLGGDVADRRITVLGAAFKPDTDDMRESPALDIARRLARSGARVTIVDPQAGPVLAGQLAESATTGPDATGSAAIRVDPGKRAAARLEVADSTEAALRGAELTLLLTEWQEFRDLDPGATARLVARPAIVDGRNVLDPDRWRSAGWEFRSLGRPDAPGGAETPVLTAPARLTA